MKKIESFKNREVLNLSAIYGGDWKSTSSKRTDENGCVETTSDKFNDTNGDGQYNPGESYVACISVNCED